MTSVSMTDNAGNKLQLKPGDDGKARVTFPVPADMSDDKHIGDPIPLWSFDEERGIWVEEGVATYNAEENVYEGYVSHFSWANLDWPEKRATIAVTVVDDDGTPIPNVKVTIGQVSKTTKKDGKAETYVPINTEFKVTVLPEDYVNYTQIQEVTVGESELEAGKTKEITITLPTLAHVSGIITNKGSGNQVATVWIEYNNKSTKKVHSDVNGKFFLSAPATSDYTGKATLKVRTADGVVKSFDIDLNGQDQSFNITIDTDVSSGGSVKAKAKETGEEFTFTISDAKDEDFEGVSIIDNMLTIVANYERKHHSQGAMEEGFDMIELNINNYNEGTTEYSINDKNYFYFNHNGYDDYANINAMSGTIKVTKQGTAYRFQIQGEGRLYADGITTNNNSNEPNVTFQADFTLSYLMNATSKRSVSSADVPANTPLLTGNSQNPLIAAIITNSSKLDKGALIAYGNKDITFDEFKALKTQADEAFGAPLENSYYNEASPNDNSNLYYFKDNNYLELVWWPWSSFTEENAMEMSSISMFMHGGTGRISITSYSGLKIPYKQFTEMMRVKKDRPNIWE